MLPRTFRRYGCAFAALILMQGHAAALVLDWGTVAWTEGSLNNSYDVDFDAINDITVSVTSNNGAGLQPYLGVSPQTPANNSVFEGGLGSTQNTLTIALNLDNAFQSITVTVSFAGLGGGATDVSFQIFDVDAGGGAQDEMTLIRGLSIDGSTLIAPIITPSRDNTLIGVGINQSVLGAGPTASTGANSGRGNVTISFGTEAIQSFTFTYGSTAAFGPNPAYQHFGIHNISFTPVPEVNPALLSVFSCLAAAGLILRRRLRGRK